MATFYIEAIEAGSITFSKYGFDEIIFKGIVTYGVNDDTTPNYYEFGTAISLDVGDRCYFKINNNATSDFSYLNYLNFSSTNKVNVGGRLSSLLGGVTNLKRNYQFVSLFSGMTNLINAKNLIFDINFNGYTNCCNSMFYRCTSLITIPELPETNLTNGCYSFMFSRCSSLKFSETKTGEYVKEYRIPKSGTGTVGTLSMESMFSNTGGTYTDDPVINTVYYIPKYGYDVTANINPSGYGEVDIDETTSETYSDDKSWEFRRYSAGATIPSLENYGDEVVYVTKTTYLDSSTALDMAIGDSYTARCTIWAYFSSDTPTSITVNSDDASRWYLDGELISTCSAFNDAKTATWNFHSGWNKVQCVYTEGAGGDGWVMSPKLNTFAEKLSSDYSFSQSCKLTPIPFYRKIFLDWTLNGYTQLEYIESSGTQYILTNYLTNLNMKVEAKVQVTGNVNGMLFGSAWDANAVLMHSNTSSVFTIYWGTSGKSYTYTLNTDLEILYENRRIVINETEFTTTSDPSNFGKLYLFGNGSYNGKFRYKYFKIYTNNVLKYDFIPVIRHSDCQIGLLDLVHFKFYGNSGSGEFIGGGEV